MTLEELRAIKFTPLVETLHFEDISDAEYFGSKYKDYISNSRLALINPLQGGSPQAFFEGLQKHNKVSDSLTFGSHLHELLLQPESFFLCESVDQPTGKAGVIAEILYNKTDKLPLDGVITDVSAKVGYYNGLLTGNRLNKLKDQLEPYFKSRYKFEQENKDLYMDKDHPEPIFTDVKSRERLKECLRSIEQNSEAQKLLNPTGICGDPLNYGFEKTILMDIQVDVPNKESFTLSLKSKLDMYVIDEETGTITVNDLKTTGRNIQYFTNAIDNFHYKREIAMYTWLLQFVAKKFYNIQSPKLKGNFLTVETIPPYASQIFNFGPKDLKWGLSEFVKLLRLVAYYKAYGYSTDV